MSRSALRVSVALVLPTSVTPRPDRIEAYQGVSKSLQGMRSWTMDALIHDPYLKQSGAKLARFSTLYA